jgi:hypothetical protein
MVGLFSAGVSYLGHEQATETRDVMQRGTAVVADVTGGSYKAQGRRTSGGHGLSLAWRTGDLLAFPTATVPISETYAESIIANNVLLISTVDIKYLASEPRRLPVIVAEAPAAIARATSNMIHFGLLSLVCLFGLGGLFVLMRRLNRVPAKNIRGAIAV